MDCPLMWLTGDLCQRKGPKLDLVHRISMPTGTSALRSLLDKAEGILHENIGPAILASRMELHVWTQPVLKVDG